MKAIAGWDSVLLQSVAEVRSGLSKSSGRQGKAVRKPYLRVANVQDGFVDLSEIKEIEVPINQIDRFTLRSGDLLLIEGNGNPENLGRGCIWAGQIHDCVHQNHIFAVRTLNHADLMPEILMLQLQSRRGRNYLLSCAKSSSGLATINSQQLKQFPVLLPPLIEQRKIAEILRTWDEAIEKMAALRVAKEQRFTAVGRRLLGPARTIGRNIPRSNWVLTTFGEVFDERQDRNRGLGPDDVVTVGKYAIRKQSEHFSRSVASKDQSNYWTISPGDFVYDPMSAYYGALGRYDGSQDGEPLRDCRRLQLLRKWSHESEDGEQIFP